MAPKYAPKFVGLSARPDIAESRQRIEEQNNRIAELTRDGHPTIAAIELLSQFDNAPAQRLALIATAIKDPSYRPIARASLR